MSQGGPMQENRERNSDFEKQSGGQDDPKFKRHWKFLLVLCGIAVLCVDPLFLYLPVINQDHKCLMLDTRLMITALCLRSVFDVIYVWNIIFGYFNRRCGGTGLDSYDRQPRQIIKRYLRSYLAIDILAILPIPQVLVPFIFSKVTRTFMDLRKILNLLVLLQYVPRVLRIYQSWMTHIKSSRKRISKRVRNIIKAAFYIFLYILASHVLGGLWYFFSIQREMACWRGTCMHGECPSSFKCGHNSSENYKLLDGACPIHPPNTTLFDFGIFLQALQSGTVSSSTSIPQKIMYCFWWGFQNLSSFGSNLQTSTYFWENCFAVFISIYGLLMFLFFIGNAQSYMQMATARAAKDMEIRSKIESWMTINELPWDMKERIINCIQDRLEETKDFDVEKLISHLSKDLISEIKRCLCFPLLKNVPQLEGKSDQHLQLICEYLKPVHYKQHSYIVREGEPLDAMLFITQGIIWNFTTSSGERNANWIEKDGFYGEELLNWGLELSNAANISNLPMSTKSLKTHTEVEAFALMASDLRTIVSIRTEAEREIELWIFRNQLPGSIKEEIMPIVQHLLEEKKDVDVQNLLSHLPIELERKIKRYICLPMLKQVPQLQGKGEQLLQLICDYLKPMHYNQHNYIVREGEPLDAMLFITQGIIWNFKTSINVERSAKCIEKGSFYGEELLEWGLECSAALPNLSDLPISLKTTKTHTKVEAFALMANDLRTIVSERIEAV